MIISDGQAIELICRRLMDREDIWWSRLICPGAWEVISDGEAEAFLTHWIATDRQSDRPPFALLYPPLGIRRLVLDFASITLWQVAVDLRFSVGSVDLVERPAARQPKLGTREGLTGLNDLRPLALTNGEDRSQPRSIPEGLQDLLDSRGADGTPPTLLRYLHEQVDGVLPALEPAAKKAADSLAPSEIAPRFGASFDLTRPEDAVVWTMLMLSLSRRAASRLCVVDPACPTAAVPAGPHDIALDLSALPVVRPKAHAKGDSWQVSCDVWVGAAIWRIVTNTDAQGVVQLTDVDWLADATTSPAEGRIGPVRFFDLNIPGMPAAGS